MTKENIMNMSINDVIRLLEQKDAEIARLNSKVETLGKKCNKYEKKLTAMHFGGEENIPKKEKKHNKHTRREFAGFHGFGYYAFVENDVFVIGYEGNREGGTIYSGEYKGMDTPYMRNIKSESPKLYNSIIKYYGY